jgi:zinc transporter ZupT
VGLVLGFGAAALISAVSFELAQEGVELGGTTAGALIVMLVDSMIPEATRQAGRTTGLVTALGFAVASAMSVA